MTTAEKAKASGFKNLKEVALMFGVTSKCLRDWDKDGIKFDVVLLGCSILRTLNNINNGR